MKGGILLGRFGGTPIIADASVFILMVLFGVAVLVDLESSGITASAQTRGLASLAAGVGIVVAVLVHELSHAAVAVHRSMIVREIRIFMFGGYSVITGKPSSSDEAVIAVAGPIASFLLAGVTGLGLVVVGSDSVAGRTAWLLMLANLAIGVFNLLPGFPLDGARLLRGVLASRSGDRLAATRVVNTIGRNMGWLTLALGVALMVARYPVGLYAIVGGWFLAQAASAVGRREELSVAFDGMTVGDVMRRTTDAVPGESTISAMLDLYALGPTLRSQPVEVQGRVVGLVGRDDIETISPPRWSSTSVRAVMSPIGPDDIVEVSDPLESLLVRPAGRSGVAVVVDEGRVVGIVDGHSLGAVL